MRGPSRPGHRPLRGRAGPAQPWSRTRPVPGRSHGLATLATVLGLLALAAWAAAASQRAVLGELRATASHIRAAEAFEAAQGGLEFGLALLHAGPLDAACQPARDPLPSLADRLGSGTVALGCQRLASGWACQCPLAAPGPDGAAGSPAPAGPVEPAGPAFRVEAQRLATGAAGAAGATVHLRATGHGSGGTARATLSMLASSPAQATSPPMWRPVPGSWRDF